LAKKEENTRAEKEREEKQIRDYRNFRQFIRLLRLFEAGYYGRLQKCPQILPIAVDLPFCNATFQVFQEMKSSLS
jgi:hypothetical protein